MRRSIVNSGEVSWPTASSPWTQLSTSPLPSKPDTGCWPGSVPWTGPAPKASPVTFQSP